MLNRLGFKFPKDEFVDYEISDFKSKLENFNDENFEIILYEMKGLFNDRKIGLNLKKNISIKTEDPVPKILFKDSIIELDKQSNLGFVYHKEPNDKFVEIIEVIKSQERLNEIRELIAKEKSVSLIAKLRNKFFNKTEESQKSFKMKFEI